MTARKPERERAEIDYRRLAERAPAILYRYRFLPNPEMEYINPAVTETLGYSPDDFYAEPDLVRTMFGHGSSPSKEPGRGMPGSPIIRRWRRRDGTYAGRPTTKGASPMSMGPACVPCPSTPMTPSA